MFSLLGEVSVPRLFSYGLPTDYVRTRNDSTCWPKIVLTRIGLTLANISIEKSLKARENKEWSLLTERAGV